MGRDISAAIRHGLDRPRIESRYRRDFPHLFRTVLGPTQPPIQWVTCFFRGGGGGEATGTWR